jgi:glutathione synthase/RimK-type ligase-like ATP-grasp enzyme
MKRVFLVSCLWFKGQRESVFLKEALEKRGIETRIVVWEDSTVDWSSADLAISRTTSSYLYDPQKFLKWAEKVEETTTIWNSSKVMRWNHHKRYIIELQDKGINVPETILIPENTDEPFETILDEIPWDDFVIKPCISAGSCGLKRFNKDSPDLESHFYSVNRDGYKIDYPGLGMLSFGSTDTLVQPFLPARANLGKLHYSILETSFLTV